MDIKVKSHLKPCAAVSIAIMIVALVMTLTGHGMNLGVDFTGGTIMTYNMGEQFETADVEKVLADNGISDAQIAKTGENDTQVQIRISDKENTDDLRTALENTLGEKYTGMEYVDISRVGAIAGRDLINNAIKSVSLAAVLMLLYIAVRFDFIPVWLRSSVCCMTWRSCSPRWCCCTASSAWRRRSSPRC